MALSTRLEFRQSQALVMTPQLMQAIKRHFDPKGILNPGKKFPVQ